MSEHTPGPWIAVERDAPSEQPVPCMPRISVGQPDSVGGPGLEQCVAWIVPRRFGGEHHAANAKLIAAAPDMLAELKRLRDVVGEEDASCIEAVIAQAEGQP